MDCSGLGQARGGDAVCLDLGQARGGDAACLDLDLAHTACLATASSLSTGMLTDLTARCAGVRGAPRGDESGQGTGMGVRAPAASRQCSATAVAVAHSSGCST